MLLGTFLLGAAAATLGVAHRRAPGTVRLEWDPPRVEAGGASWGLVGYAIYIQDAEGVSHGRVRTREEHVILRRLEPGRYAFAVATVDRSGHESRKSGVVMRDVAGVRRGWTGILAAILATLGSLVPGTSFAAPYPQSSVFSGITFNWGTHDRRAPGSDNWPLTWADDDHQYTSWGDGGGFSGTNEICRVSLGVARVEGTALSYAGRDLWGAASCALSAATLDGKSYAILAVDGVLYMWRGPLSDTNNLDFQRLYRSTDHGLTWQDTGVQFTYSQHRIGMFGFLQFGRDYQGARDGYVYIYATELKDYNFGIQRPGEVLLIRVPKGSMTNAASYEFFAGLDTNGSPTWGSHAQRRPVFVDANGLFLNSAIYNPALGRYLLVTNHTAIFQGNIGIFDAPEPWGPWSTVAYESRWPSGGQVERTVFYANFAPKWWSNGGKDFVFVFTGTSSNDSWNSVRGSFVLAESDPVPPAPPENLRVVGP